MEVDKIIGSSYELRCQGHKVGDEVWACEYVYNFGKECVELKCPPCKGILSQTSHKYKKVSEEAHKFLIESGNTESIGYFVPYGKNGKLSWSKAVYLHSRHYAKDEESCKVLYEQRVNSCIEKAKYIISEIQTSAYT